MLSIGKVNVSTEYSLLTLH